MNLEQFLSPHLREPQQDGGELKAFCPFHLEERPSFSVNLTTGAWRCFSGPGCGGGRNIKSLCRKMKLEIPGDLEFIPSTPKPVEPRYVPLEVAKSAAEAIFQPEGAGALAYLKGRGVSEDAIRSQAVGYYNGRIGFPIFDAQDRCTNVHLYDFTKQQNAKFIWYGSTRDGYASRALWPGLGRDSGEEVYLLAGEPDCLLALSLGLSSAVTATVGEGAWDDDFTRALAGKTVFILYDIDAAGVAGAQRVAHALRLASKAVVVPLPITTPKNGDFTDFVQQRNPRAADIVSMCHAALTQQAQRIALGGTAGSDVFGKEVELRAAVAGKDLSPYMVPKRVRIGCSPREDHAACAGCPLRALNGNLEKELEDGCYPQIAAVFSSTKMVEQELRAHLGIPLRCPGHHMEVLTHVPMWDVRLINDLDSEEGREDGQFIARRAFTKEDLTANVPYELGALATLDPKTQRSLLYIKDAESSQSGLDKFTIEGKEHLLKIWEV